MRCLSAWLGAIYGPVLKFCLQFRYLVLAVALGGLVMAATLALSFGSEFVPRLSEGAIVIGIVRPPGTSLEESIRVNTQIEQHAVGNISGRGIARVEPRRCAEVATDASSVEMTDLFVELKPRERWKRATTQDELVGLMEGEVADIPGQINWFTQPIEQRINEMISGVRSDVAVKLFGDDFDTLVKYARELEGILREVRGSVDLATEQIVGQPVLQIRIRQDQVARYGVSALLVLDTVQSIGGIELWGRDRRADSLSAHGPVARTSAFESRRH